MQTALWMPWLLQSLCNQSRNLSIVWTGFMPLPLSFSLPLQTLPRHASVGGIEGGSTLGCQRAPQRYTSTTIMHQAFAQWSRGWGACRLRRSVLKLSVPLVASSQTTNGSMATSCGWPSTVALSPGLASLPALFSPSLACAPVSDQWNFPIPTHVVLREAQPFLFVIYSRQITAYMSL